MTYMNGISDLQMTVFDALIVGLALVLVILYRRDHSSVAKLGLKSGFALIFLGVFSSSAPHALHLISTFSATEAVGSSHSGHQKALWLEYLVIAGDLLIFLGLAQLFTRLIPKTSDNLSSLEKLKLELSVSNSKLANAVIEKNTSLEALANDLRQEKESSLSALSQSEQKFRCLFDESPAIFLLISERQSIQEINSFGANILGYTPSELIGHPLSKIVIEDDHSKLRALHPDKINEKSEHFELEVKFIHQDKEPLWVKVNSKVIHTEALGQCLLLVCQDISESKSLAEILSFQATHDELTQLYNRRGLERYLAGALDAPLINPHTTALLYFDVDQLKVVNDTCGHVAGDRLLQQLVAIIGEACKESDFFARIGGDEFAIVKTHSSKEDALRIAEGVRGAAEDFTFVWEQQTFRQSISVGVALTSPKINSIIDILGAADAACYAAKEGGKNRVVLHSESVEDPNDRRNDMLWVSRLQKAIQQGHFELYFQPIVPLDSDKEPHVHYEFLIRYADDNGEHITPNHFLPAAERFGFSEQIDLWVITTALDYLHKHPKHTRSLDCCSINLTSHSIANHRTRSAIIQLVKSYEFPMNKICFEITESSAIRNLSEAIEFINELKILGCQFALDDFGTGFSSFGYLKNLDVDYIKIDGSFVKDIVHDRIDRAMVTAVNNVGREMNIETIAEYAENDLIIDELAKIHVNYGQGYAIARPMPITELEDYYLYRDI